MAELNKPGAVVIGKYRDGRDYVEIHRDRGEGWWCEIQTWRNSLTRSTNARIERLCTCLQFRPYKDGDLQEYVFQPDRPSK